MAVWVLHGGQHGEREECALNENILTIGWGNVETPLNQFREWEQILDQIQPLVLGKTKGAVTLYARQLWKFANEIKLGDVVVLRLRAQPIVAIGKVSGEYHHHPG